jgi:predicted HicB family RNase H-like nuclease
MRGRPPKAERMVPIMVMVPPTLKETLRREAQAANITLSQLIRQILGSPK